MPGFVIQQHAGPLPPPAQVQDYEAAYPGAAKWIFDQAERNAEHFRTMELRAVKLQRLDVLLQRLLPFGLVLAFLIASVVIAFASPAAGAVSVLGTMAGVLYAYLTGRMPSPPSQPPATPPATPP